MLQKKCTQCVMDDSDPSISFDIKGICNHCHRFTEIAQKKFFPNEKGEKFLQAFIKNIKEKQKNKKYDVILGLSGGVDSSFLAYWSSKIAGFRTLAVHVDCGWNSPQAVKNIENIVKKLNIDLHTVVIDWREMKDVQRAFLKSGVPNQDIPQDHAIFAALYKSAEKLDIRFLINGSNIATESILPSSWGYNALDGKHLKAIHKKFGAIKLKTFPIMSLFQNYFIYPFVKKIKTISPLHYMEFDKEQAVNLLTKELAWESYGAKHFESRFTKFFQSYWIIERFGYDKRLAHLSSLIVSGHMTREDALKLLKYPPYDPKIITFEKEFIAKKLGFSIQELEHLLKSSKKYHEEFPSHQKIFTLIRKIYIFLTPLTRH